MLRGGFALLLLFVVWEASAMRVGNFTPRFEPKFLEDTNEKAEERSSYSYVYLPSLGDKASFYTKGQYQGSFYSLSVIGPDFSYLNVACNFRVAGGSFFSFSARGSSIYYYCPARYWYCIWTIRSVARVNELTFRMYSWSEDWYMDAAECTFDVERGQESTTGFTASTTASTTPTTASTTPTTASTTGFISSTTAASTSTTTPSSANPNGPSILNTCECGKRANTRIVGGNEAPDNKYPFAARLRLEKETGYSLCGGTVISDEYILTAAHCTPGVTKVYALLGTNKKGDLNNGQEFTSEIIIDHPDYNTNTNEYDISLLKLTTPIDFSGNDRIRPVCLPRGSNSYERTSATAIGWGTLSSGGSTSDDLMEVVVPIVTNAQCAVAYGSDITENSICAGRKGKDSCQGDSGGPLLHQNAGDFYDVIGVTSFGNGCGLKGHPGVYARVTAVMEWINDQIKESSTCTTPA